MDVDISAALACALCARMTRTILLRLICPFQRNKASSLDKQIEERPLGRSSATCYVSLVEPTVAIMQAIFLQWYLKPFTLGLANAGLSESIRTVTTWPAKDVSVHWIYYALFPSWIILALLCEYVTCVSLPQLVIKYARYLKMTPTSSMFKPISNTH